MAGGNSRLTGPLLRVYQIAAASICAAEHYMTGRSDTGRQMAGGWSDPVDAWSGPIVNSGW